MRSSCEKCHDSTGVVWRFCVREKQPLVKPFWRRVRTYYEPSDSDSCSGLKSGELKDTCWLNDFWLTSRLRWLSGSSALLSSRSCDSFSESVLINELSLASSTTWGTRKKEKSEHQHTSTYFVTGWYEHLKRLLLLQGMQQAYCNSIIKLCHFFTKSIP